MTKEQLELCSEDEIKEVVIDSFDEKYLEIGDFEENNHEGNSCFSDVN